MNTKMYNKGTSNNNNNNSTTSNLNISISTSSSNGQASANSPGGSSTTATTTTTTDRIEWSRATILDFIEDYRRQRVLWDPNTKGYHIKQTKYEALKALGYKYGAEIRSIRSKIKSLRSSFHREHGKVLNGRRKGLNYQPMWFAYDAIRFILDGEAGDSDDAETHKNDSNTTRETLLAEPNNNNNNHLINIDEELMEERKISSRDIEHFNNHFLALGLQARHPMAVIAAVEAAAAATAAQERRQEQENALRQQQQQQIDAATQLKLLELTTNIVKNNKTNNINGNNNDCTLTTTSTSQFNPISKSINSSKPTSPLPLVLPAPTSSATITTTSSAVTITATATPPPPPPFTTNTCSSENLNVLHGSRSLDENAALVAATAIPSLSITAVARNSDFDGSEYCNISADDVKTEIFESDSNELAMLESTRTSTPVPLNYHKNITDLTTTSKSNTVVSSNNSNNIANISRSNINGGVTGSRKRKLQTQSNVNLNHSSEDVPSSSKLRHKQVHQQLQQQLQHSNAIHSRQCDYLNSNNNNHNVNINNMNSNQLSHHHDNNNSTANNENVEDNEDDNDDDDDGAGYSTSFSHLQTTLINAGNGNGNSNVNGNGNISSSSHNCKLNIGGSSNSSAPIDEYGVFGEYVAITIRKLKTSKAKIVVKHLINNLLYEAEMGKYDQGISSCKEPPELYKM